MPTIIHWCFISTLCEQHARLGGFTAPYTISRLLTSLKMTTDAAKKPAAPHDKFVDILSQTKEGNREPCERGRRLWLHLLRSHE